MFSNFCRCQWRDSHGRRRYCSAAEKIFKDNPPLRLWNNFAASRFNIRHIPSGMHEVDWHNPPQRLLVLWLTGEVEFETSDGDIRIINPRA